MQLAIKNISRCATFEKYIFVDSAIARARKKSILIEKIRGRIGNNWHNKSKTSEFLTGKIFSDLFYVFERISTYFLFYLTSLNYTIYILFYLFYFVNL